MKLIRLPVDEYNNALKVAELTEFVPVMECFKYHGRCLASSYIIQVTFKLRQSEMVLKLLKRELSYVR